MSWLTKNGEVVSHLTKTAVKTVPSNSRPVPGRFQAVVADGRSPRVDRWAAVSGRTLGISQEVVGPTSGMWHWRACFRWQQLAEWARF